MTLPSDKKASANKGVFQRAKISLIDDDQWVFLRKRYHFSARELQVAKYVCRGYNNEEISEALDIAQGTIKTHIRNIYRRVRVKRKIDLLLRLIEDVKRLYYRDHAHRPGLSIVELRDKTGHIVTPAKTHKKGV